MNNHFITVPVSTNVFLELVDFLREQGDVRSPCDMVTVAIDYWIENASWKSDDLIKKAEVLVNRGYMWGSVFLPHDTDIRMKYKEKNYYAKVDGDLIMYEGKSFSPSELAAFITKTSRNAWRDLYIKRPQDQNWALADDLRSAKSDLKNLAGNLSFKKEESNEPNINEFLSKVGTCYGSCKNRYFKLLEWLYISQPEKFSICAPLLKGHKRIYFAQSAEEIEKSGNSTEPEKIPSCPWYTITNISNREKKVIIQDLMKDIGYNQNDIKRAIEYIDG